MESPHQDLIIRRCRGPADGSWKDLLEPNPWRGIVCQPKGAIRQSQEMFKRASCALTVKLPSEQTS
jgi:hypothetical protein